MVFEYNIERINICLNGKCVSVFEIECPSVLVAIFRIKYQFPTIQTFLSNGLSGRHFRPSST